MKYLKKISVHLRGKTKSINILFVFIIYMYMSRQIKNAHIFIFYNFKNVYDDIIDNVYTRFS